MCRRQKKTLGWLKIKQIKTPKHSVALSLSLSLHFAYKMFVAVPNFVPELRVSSSWTTQHTSAMNNFIKSSSPSPLSGRIDRRIQASIEMAFEFVVNKIMKSLADNRFNRTRNFDRCTMRCLPV